MPAWFSDIPIPSLLKSSVNAANVVIKYIPGLLAMTECYGPSKKTLCHPGLVGAEPSPSFRPWFDYHGNDAQATGFNTITHKCPLKRFEIESK